MKVALNSYPNPAEEANLVWSLGCQLVADKGGEVRHLGDYRFLIDKPMGNSAWWYGTDDCWYRCVWRDGRWSADILDMLGSLG